MNAVDIPFGEWLPSAPTYKNPGCLDADNTIPAPGGYAPWPAPVAVGVKDSGDAALTGPVRGAALFFSTINSPVIVGGSATRLFTVRGGLSVETTGLTAIGSGDAWDFAQFNNIIVATHSSVAPQYLDNVDSDDSWTALPGSPPQAKFCARVEDFLMLGNLASNPNRVQWSAFNSPASSWTPARLTQAGFADLPSVFGPVHRIVGGRFPMVFQERGVSRLEYIGPPVVWRLTEVEQARGALAPFSVVTVGFATYFLAQDGFWVTDGAAFQSIGSQRINRWFFDTADAATIREVHAAVDWRNECIVWAFKSRGSSVFDRCVRYSWSEDRWSPGTLTLGRLVESTTDGLTLEQLGALYPDLEDVPGSLDDARWASKFRTLAAFIDDGATTDLHTFDGAPLAARIVTGDFQPAPGQRVFAGGARVLGDDVSVWRVAAGPTDNIGFQSYGTPRVQGVDGFRPLRSDGMEMRLSCTTQEGDNWSRVQGAQVRFRVSGKR